MIPAHTSFGFWLRKARRALDLTQEELATRVGCSTVFIRKLEADVRQPSLMMAERLADALQIPAMDRATFLKLVLGGASAIVDMPQPVIEQAPWHGSLSPPLVGRIREREAVCQQLMRPAVRLLTLTGPAGIGKSHLAVAVAEALQGNFLDAISWVPLQKMTDPQQLVGILAVTCGIGNTDDTQLEDAVEQHLRDRAMLLVLDGIEPHPALAVALTRLLRAAPGIKLLATSRGRLAAPCERVYPLEPLAIPDLVSSGCEFPPSKQLATNDAVTLFLQQVHVADPTFRLTEDNTPAVMDICRATGGLPLALVLAASCSVVFSLERVLSWLDPDGFRPSRGDGPSSVRYFLRSGGFSERHPPDGALVLWDFLDRGRMLLAPDVQVLLRRLAVFMGPFSAECANAVCATIAARPPGMTTQAGTALDDVSASLTLLCRCGWLARQDQFGSGSALSLPWAIHNRARHWLAESGEEEALREQHAHYYLAWLEQALPAPPGEVQPEPGMLQLLADHRDDLQQALSWLLQQGATTTTLSEAHRPPGPTWRPRGMTAVAYSWLQNLRAHRAAFSPPLYAQALHAAAYLTVLLGDMTAARAFSTERAATLSLVARTPQDVTHAPS